MNRVKLWLSLAVSMGMLMLMLAPSVSATIPDGTYNGATFIQEFWGQKYDSERDVTHYWIVDAYRDITRGANNPAVIWAARLYESPAEDEDWVVEDSEQFCKYRFYNPYSDGAQTNFNRFEPSEMWNFNQLGTLTVAIGYEVSYSSDDGISSTTGISIAFSEPYYEKKIVPDAMTATQYRGHGDIDANRASAHAIEAACAMNILSTGYQSIYFYSEGHFEDTGWFGGTNFILTDLSQCSVYQVK